MLVPAEIREVCKLLIADMPEEGLMEALATLKEMWEFYYERLQAQREEHMREAENVVQHVSAVLGKTYTRPEFFVDPADYPEYNDNNGGTG